MMNIAQLMAPATFDCGIFVGKLKRKSGICLPPTLLPETLELAHATVLAHTLWTLWLPTTLVSAALLQTVTLALLAFSAGRNSNALHAFGERKCIGPPP